MNDVLAIDPGLHGCGVACFSEKRLRWARYIKGPDGTGPAAWAAMGAQVPYTACPAVIEVPRVYPGPRHEDPNDLVALAGVVGAISASLFAEGGVLAVGLFPAEWKGQVPKKIMTARILLFLSAEELARVERVGAKDHNTIDAVGIGLFILGRMLRGGVAP